MADAGLLVTDDEVVKAVSSFDKNGLFERELIKGVEAAIAGACHQKLVNTSYSDELQLMRTGDQQFDGWTTQSLTAFRLKRFPINTFTALKTVSSWSATTGLPETTSAIPMNVYSVDLEAGIVSLLPPGGSNPWLYQNVYPGSSFMSVWPGGGGSLLASYTYGFTTATCPWDLKQAVLMMISRLHKMKDKFQYTTFGAAQQTPTTLRRIDITPEEMTMFRKYIKELVA